MDGLQVELGATVVFISGGLSGAHMPSTYSTTRSLMPKLDWPSRWLGAYPAKGKGEVGGQMDRAIQRVGGTLQATAVIRCV